ncbi:MAG TPA: alpha/beta hydrolase [Flavobacterium sp.]|jgi:pimeloyl-ACP methyl ester carboxylesterase
MQKIPIYFVPGLAANTLIFEKLKFPEDQFECTFLEWEIPLEKESLKDYAKRLCRKIVHEKPVLIGVSLGGLVVQEMANCIEVSKVIIISSAKSYHEYPRLFHIAKKTGIYKLVPTRLLLKLEKVGGFPFNRKIDERLKLYRKYLGVRDKKYWRWAIEQVVMWDRDMPDKRVIHIHGDEDEIFPAKKMENYIKLPGGTHIMLVKRYRWLNEKLPKIILDQPFA